MWACPLLYIIKFRGKVLKDGVHLLRKKILWDPKQINTKFFSEYKMRLYSLYKTKVSQKDSTCQILIDFKRFPPPPGFVLNLDIPWKVHLHTLLCLPDLWWLPKILLDICLWSVACLYCCKYQGGRNPDCRFYCSIPGAKTGLRAVSTW